MKITKIYLDRINKWTLIIEGITDKGKDSMTMTAIPPTDGNRTDIINTSTLGEGYQYNCKGLIIIKIIDGQPKLELID